MFAQINELIKVIDDAVWGLPLICLIMVTGILLTVRLGGVQVRHLGKAFKFMFQDEEDGHGEVTSFGALCTALSATIGTGNIAGVATAIAAGGPGALFWMVVAAFFGMATKYAEGLLAIKYRSVDKNRNISGGPMYYIRKGMGEKYKPLAIFFAFATMLVAFFGIGTFPQVNAIIDSVNISFGVPKLATNIVLTVIVGSIIFGGLKNIAKVTSKLIPFMAIFYIGISFVIICMNITSVPDAIRLIVKDAFTGSAAVGGFAGSTIMMAMQSGVARGIFSNEAGLGSAPIAAAAAKTHYPSEQGLISMTGTFIDTIIVCSMTGLVLVLTGVWSGENSGAAMTSAAFVQGFGNFGSILLTLSLVLFAFTTILGWNYYGERACVYLFGVKGITPYRVIFIAMIALGVFLKLDIIWILADIVNGLMAVPNLIALVALSGVVVEETKLYLNMLKTKAE